jgi:hypothetical protein
MSCFRTQAHLDAPPETLCGLVGNPERHPEWWPRVIGVQCDGLDEGCSYRQVLKSARYFRSWLDQSIAALRVAAHAPSQGGHR